MGDNGSKTEKPTAKKRNDARKKGNVFKSQDINTVVSLFIVFFALQKLFPFIYAGSRDFLKTCIDYINEMDHFTNQEVLYIQNQIIILLAKCMGPILLISMTVGILTTGVQTKFLFSKESMTPKFNRLNPINGIKNMFSSKNAIELIKNIIKVIILMIVVYQFIKGSIIEVTSTMNMELEVSMRYILNKVMSLIRTVTMWFVVIAFFDFLYQRWEHERQLKMTKQEVKDEYKEMEGDPKIKGKIKEMQKKIAMNRMMQAVPAADVIIRNPTHFAVALRYKPNENEAPVLVAKGQDELALRIVKVGEENKVYIVENKPLARAIYASTEINQEIPPEYYGAIAEILVYVYKLNKNVLK